MLRNKTALAKLTEEVRSAFETTKDITFRSAANLPYLDAALKETLRVYPPAAIRLPRRTPADGAVIDGHFVPADASSPAQLPSVAKARLTSGTDFRRGGPVGRLPLLAQLRGAARVRAGALARGGGVCRRRPGGGAAVRGGAEELSREEVSALGLPGRFRSPRGAS